MELVILKFAHQCLSELQPILYLPTVADVSLLSTSLWRSVRPVFGKAMAEGGLSFLDLFCVWSNRMILTVERAERDDRNQR